MKISFPRNRTAHKRDYSRELTIVIKVKGVFINWNDAQRIHFAVQEIYDRQDMLDEISCRIKHKTMTRKEAASVADSMDALVSRYRMLLDEGIGENWNDTLGYVIEDYLENGMEE